MDTIVQKRKQNGTKRHPNPNYSLQTRHASLASVSRFGVLMHKTAEDVLAHLRPLVGLPLSIARSAGSMGNFQFGQVRERERGTVGEFALHVDCPWRIEGPRGMEVGSNDIYHPAEEPDPDFDWDAFNEDLDGNLRLKLFVELLGSYDEKTRSAVNVTEHLVVEDVEADSVGGAVLRLSGRYRLVIFPATTRGENWRIFEPGRDGPHFVIAGGKVEDEET